MLFLFLIIISLLKENADANTINPLDPEKRITVGDNVTLSCQYSGIVNTLQWYRQYPGSQIEYLIFATELSGRSEPALRLESTANRGTKRMHLNIFLTQMEDSALYYCALVPTVTMFLLVLLVFSPLRENADAEVITPFFTKQNVFAEEDITLSCNYSGYVQNLQWYRQYPGSKPENIIFHTESNRESKPKLRLYAVADKENKMLLLTFIIFSLLKENAAADDVIKPVFTEKHVLEGKDVTLICNYTETVQNLQWYRQYPGSKPVHLIMFFETIPKSDPDLRLNAAADKATKTMNLTISSTEVKDSAMYYCALVPTVTGNTTTLYKN
ncbi:hypothetical protein QQF64_015155 [Cirrhinus molitorella]|uniref:Ig-like domain-containing protein n=1 Tax=Cirrhinus molitorella TaxID=172907 RepID=A0ABR3NVK5_9TELE